MSPKELVTKVNIKQQVVIIGNMLKMERNNMIDTKQIAKYIFEEYANCYSKVDIEELAKYLDGIKNEAIKEFADRLKERQYLSSEWSHGEHPYVVEEDDIDNLVEEMTEDQNDV